MEGIKYLEERLSKIEITDRILRNLRAGIESNDVLKNHIDYCMRNRIKEVLPFALNEIAKARGQSLAQMALAWLLKDPRVTSVLIGASSVAQLEDNLKTLKILNFTGDELSRIESILVV